MNAYLIAEEGPLVGITVAFEETLGKTEWVLGRDPDVADVTLEDPMVSRKHAIMHITPEGFLLENLSSVNPATQNGMIIVDPVLLKEGDIIQIGNTFFRFTEKTTFAPQEPVSNKEESPSTFIPPKETRWMLKVISGPNTGAEFSMKPSSIYILGKDPNICDVVFQDLSVSRQHARLNVDDDENVFIEDLSSRNGVIINGELMLTKHKLDSEDLIALGTTTFIVIDRQKARETIISPPPAVAITKEERPEEKMAARSRKIPTDWREIVIPKRHLLLAGVFAALILICIVGMFSLFKTETIVVKEVDEKDGVQQIIKQFPAVQYSFNQPSGKLFIVGHVLTGVDKQELMYLLKELPFIQDIEDNVIIDEYVWQNMNALLSRNPTWAGVSMYAPKPGQYVLRGYLKTTQDAEVLSDYVNLNFPYLDRLMNQVIVEGNLTTEIQSMLTEKGFANVSFQLSNGEVVLSGIVEEKHNKEFNELIQQYKALPGIRLVKNYVVMTSQDTSRIDLSDRFPVTGNSQQDHMNFFVVIDGHIYGQGDILEGYKITKVDSNLVLLEKDGLKYKINYNLQ